MARSRQCQSPSSAWLPANYATRFLDPTHAGPTAIIRSSPGQDLPETRLNLHLIRRGCGAAVGWIGAGSWDRHTASFLVAEAPGEEQRIPVLLLVRIRPAIRRGSQGPGAAADIAAASPGGPGLIARMEEAASADGGASQRTRR